MIGGLSVDKQCPSEREDKIATLVQRHASVSRSTKCSFHLGSDSPTVAASRQKKSGRVRRRNPDETKFDDLECRGLLGAGGAGCGYGFICAAPWFSSTCSLSECSAS